jgi:adenosylcobinamide kinase / adenosylcobinamide-phosphate guanylyltransferase
VGRKILIIGGARSGKSDFAQMLIKQSELPATYVATAEVTDNEMAYRIDRHKKERPQTWPTIEAPYLLPARITSACAAGRAVILDCLAVYVSNACVSTLHPYHDTFNVSQLTEVESAIMGDVKSALEKLSHADLSIVVSNEVGLAIVPDNALARAYRDILGRCNQIAAHWADEVYFVITGLPMKLKGPR